MGARSSRTGARHAGFALATLLMLTLLASSVPAAGAAPIAYPDLRVLVPTSDIYVVQEGTARTLEFTHITSDTGAGPLEIRPHYDAATGISQGYQALYTHPSPGVWTFDHTVPIVGPMIWVPPSDYRFPLAKFWLYNTAAGGGVGKIVATSPKNEFCMTSDTFVGEVSEPANDEYNSDECTGPEGVLGFSVGWGDQYDATDGGEGIAISSLPTGTYWLRAEADPDHYLQEENTANNITDTKLRIEGATVTVLEQKHPSSTPPTVTVTSPGQGAALAGSVELTASATGPATIKSVQFLLDGEPIGSPVTSAPYSITWNSATATAGPHFISAQATDSRGFVGTAADIPIEVVEEGGTIAGSFDAVTSETGSSTDTTPPISTSTPGDLLLALVGADGPEKGQEVKVTGGGLTWKRLKRSADHDGDAEIWDAKLAAGRTLSGASVTSTEVDGGFEQALTVVAIKHASGVGATASAGKFSGAPSVTITTKAAGSYLLAVGTDAQQALARTPGPGQMLLTQLFGGTGETFWTQYAREPSATVGEKITLNDIAPTADPFDMAGVEVLAETPAKETPAVSITNPVASEVVSETIPVSANASDGAGIASVQFYLDGQKLGAPVTSPPYATSWDTTKAANGNHTLTAVATDDKGEVGESSPVTVKVENPAEKGPCFVMDAKASVDGTGQVTTPSFTTAEGGEQLLAFVSSDGPWGAGQQSATVSGAGLSWSLVKRANARSGDAEIWTATAPTPLNKVTVTSTPTAGGYDQSLTVIAMQMSLGVGASAAAGAASGEPTVSLHTTEEGSLVFGVGSDYSNAIPRTLGPNQVLLHEYVDKNNGDTFWSQYTGQITGAAGTNVTLNDTAPTTDEWNMAAVELRGDGPGE